MTTLNHKKVTIIVKTESIDGDTEQVFSFETLGDDLYYTLLDKLINQHQEIQKIQQYADAFLEISDMSWWRRLFVDYADY